MTHHRSRTAAIAVLAMLVTLTAFVAATKASPPTGGVTATVLARGTFDGFNVRSDPLGPIADFRAHSTGQVDLVVRRHDYPAGSATGWHGHPGPIFITVTQGQLTYYEYSDPTCAPHVVTAGHGFVDDGGGHIVRNETTQPAQDISVIVAPVGSAFRSELTAPGPYCTF